MHLKTMHLMMLTRNYDGKSRTTVIMIHEKKSETNLDFDSVLIQLIRFLWTGFFIQ